MMVITTTKEAFAQIEACDFANEAGPIANNVGYAWLRDYLAFGPLYCLGQWVVYKVEGEVSGVKIAQNVKLCVVGIQMSSDAERRTWTYSLSSDPPSAYHYGSGVQFLHVAERLLSPFVPAPPLPTAPSDGGEANG